MTPAQMLRRIPMEQKPASLIWTPVERTRPIVLPPGMTHAEMHFQEESAALREGKCPLCGAHLEHEVQPDQMVYFTCVKQKVFHQWRRSLAFLTND